MAKYSKDQISRYLSYIALDPSEQEGKPCLPALTRLIARHLAAVPFESISLHYSLNHHLSLDPDTLYRKIVGTGRGGYCMENNTFFGTVLRSLGYELIYTGGRVSDATAGRPGPGFTGWNHMVSLVKLDGQRYLVDVGFGGSGPCRPIPLTTIASSSEMPGIGPQRIRVGQRTLEQHSDPNQKVWVYSHRHSEETEWVDGYAFTEVEFFPGDFEVMNLATMTLRQSYFVQTLVCVKVILDEKEQPVGQLILRNAEVRKQLNGTSEVVEVFKKEEDRIAGLKKWFCIQISDDDKKGIVDLPTEIRGWAQ